MIERSESLDQILAALVMAQGEFPEITKDANVNMELKSGRRVEYDYAELPDIQSIIKPILLKHKLTYSQMIGESEKGPVLTTIVGHSSGQWFASDSPILLKPDPGVQDFGSSITYQKRYSVVAAFGLIVKDSDDDGNRAQGNRATITPKFKQSPAPGKSLPSAPRENEQASRAPGDYVIKFGTKLKGKKLSEIPEQDLRQYLNWLEESAASKGKPLSGDALELVQAAESFFGVKS